MSKVTKDTKIGDLLMMDREAAIVLMQAGMHCVGCPSSAGETLEEAGFVHGMDVNKLVGDINDFFEQKESGK